MLASCWFYNTVFVWTFFYLNSFILNGDFCCKWLFFKTWIIFFCWPDTKKNWLFCWLKSNKTEFKDVCKIFFWGNHAIKQTFNRSAKNYVNYEARKSLFVCFLNGLIDFWVSFLRIWMKFWKWDDQLLVFGGI